MGATRLASGKKPCSYTKYKGSQTALITRLAVSFCLDFSDAGRVAPISACVWCLSPFVCLRSAGQQSLASKSLFAQGVEQCLGHGTAIGSGITNVGKYLRQCFGAVYLYKLFVFG